MIDPRVASGLRDIPPSAMIPRERMLDAFRKTFSSFGFLPIETPHIERVEVLTGKGAGSDEVLRQIFDVTNKGGTPGELALRFDLTVPLARFIARHVDELGIPFKRYAIGSVFRGERPAKGRFREFVQCDFDTVGTTSPLADAETVNLIYSALTNAGVPKFTIWINNRQILNGFLHLFGADRKLASVLRALDKLDKIGEEKVIAELTRPAESEPAGAGLSDDQARELVVFAALQGGAEILDDLQARLPADSPAQAGIQNLREILALLRAAEVPDGFVRVKMGLARGLDYYTGVVFETTVDGWERFGSISSGGRYDNLASLFTSRKLPGVGASIGLDRLVALLEESNQLPKTGTTVPVLVAHFPGVSPSTPVALASRLRAAGIGAEVYPDPIQIGKQMGYGTIRGHKLAVIVGPDEEEKQVFNLRLLSDRTEDKGLAWSVLEDSVRGALGVLEQRESS
jgi:histidyl-tRNA synthetase